MKIQGKHCTTSLGSHNVISRPEHVNMNKTSAFPYTIPFSLSAEIPAVFPDFNLLLYFGELLRVCLEQTGYLDTAS